jgi:hypothetical protein
MNIKANPEATLGVAAARIAAGDDRTHYDGLDGGAMAVWAFDECGANSTKPRHPRDYRLWQPGQATG